MERDAAMWWRPGGSDLVLFDVSSASDIPFDGCIVHLSANHSLSLFTPRFLCAVHPTRPSMADNHKSPLRPEGEDLLQVSYIQPFLYTLYLTFFMFVLRQPSPTHSPSPTSPASLLSSQQHHPLTQSQHLQGHRMRCSPPQRRQRHRPSPPYLPRSSTPGRQSTRHKSPSGAGRARPCVHAPR